MPKLRVAYFGKGVTAITLLRTLADNPEVEVVAVAAWKASRKSWANAPAIGDVAQELGLPTVDTEESLGAIPFDVLFSVYYDRIIGKGVLDLARVASINLHAALLPDYRGRFTFLYAILNGEAEYGVTLHLIDEGIDTGAIIAKRSFPITSVTTAQSLYDQTAEEAIALFNETLPSIIDGSFNPTPQSSGRYMYRTGDLPDGEVDLSWDPDYLDRFVRAMYFPPFDPAYLKINNKTYFLTPDIGKDLTL